MYDYVYIILQASADDGRDHIVLHADLTELGLRSTMESCGQTSRRYLPENLVEKFPIHP